MSEDYRCAPLLLGATQMETTVSLLVLWLTDLAATAKDRTGNIQPSVALAVTTVVAVFL